MNAWLYETIPIPFPLHELEIGTRVINESTDRSIDHVKYNTEPLPVGLFLLYDPFPVPSYSMLRYLP